MTVKEIIAIELANTHSIYLLKEGMFYRAYNRSAMRMVSYLKPFKVNHKYVKTVQQEIFYVGFPCTSLASIKNQLIDKGWSIVEAPKDGAGFDQVIVLSEVSNREEDYQMWVENQLQHSLTTCPTVQSLEKQIDEFSIENATPMDALLFVNKLKQQIRNGNV